MSEPSAETTSTVLIVDDTPANLGVIAAHLEDNGFDVAIAQNGEDGIRRAQRVQPDLILLDVMMPGIDGFETCRRLKAEADTRDIPVIFMTALAETDDKVAGFAAGGVDYVTKPIQVAEVLVRINTHLALVDARRRLAAQNEVLQHELEERRQAEAALAAANGNLSDALATLKRTQGRLIRSAKLAGLGALVAGVAHELNTPIGNALLSSSTLCSEARNIQQRSEGGHLSRSEFTKFVSGVIDGGEMLIRNLRRAGELIQQFKQVAVDQFNDRRRLFNLDEAVRDAVMTFLLNAKQETYRVDIVIDPSLQIESYPGAIDQIVSHLFSNAIRHAFEPPSSGVIRIAATPLNDDWYTLSFSDSGKGIASNRLRNIFDPFYMARLGSGGSGIGLY
ncbi:MAG TPA: hybrid sensor histidine kinase/response regulator, partial [Rhodocyclaceae bacterium]|nr:hybrid sensor histidine kinase/response regulator [Rhodocyclaceae bacterium]